MNRKGTSGFTLIELLVVVAILATLAGLVISRVDFARRQADMSAAAGTAAELARNIQIYEMTKGVLPDGVDSLLGSDGNISKWIYDSSPSLVPQAGAKANTKVVTLPAAVVGSLGRMGVLTVMDLDPASTYATDAGTIARSIDRALEPVKSSGAPVLVIRPGSAIWNDIYPPAVWGTPTADEQAGLGDTTRTPAGGVGSMHMPSADIIARVGAGSTDQVRNVSFGLNTDVYLVVLGIGKGCSMNGVTFTNPPVYPAPDPDSRYYRYVAVIACYGDGRRAQFKTVLDPFGRSNAGDLQQFIQAKPN
jgi:prepilin-type N-terminal cleavage/methylation domain-containing protein